MKLRNETTPLPSYPTVRNLLIGATMTLSLAMVGCKGESKKETTPNTGDPSLPAKKSAGSTDTSKPVDPGKSDGSTKQADTSQPPAEPDSDGDGIPDRIDRCPKLRGAKVDNGCPRKMPLPGLPVRPRNPHQP